MKEFTSAVEEVVFDAEREARIAELVAEGMEREEAERETEPYAEFMLDGRVIRAYQPNEGQLTFMLAAMGRGQTQDSRAASIINLLMESLRESDKDYIESRLISRGKDRLPPKTIEKIFESLVQDWFARPTQPASGSAPSQPNAGANSTPTTTPSPED